MKRLEFTRQPIPGYEWESTLLEQWAAWVFSGGLIQSFSNGSPSRDLWMNESEIEKVEATIIRLDKDTQRILKAWYLRGNVDYAGQIRTAVIRFSYEHDTENKFDR